MIVNAIDLAAPRCPLVVCDTENTSPGKDCIKRCTMVVLPHPEGAERTMSIPSFAALLLFIFSQKLFRIFRSRSMVNKR